MRRYGSPCSVSARQSARLGSSFHCRQGPPGKGFFRSFFFPHPSKKLLRTSSARPQDIFAPPGMHRAGRADPHGQRCAAQPRVLKNNICVATSRISHWRGCSSGGKKVEQGACVKRAYHFRFTGIGQDKACILNGLFSAARSACFHFSPGSKTPVYTSA